MGFVGLVAKVVKSAPAKDIALSAGVGATSNTWQNGFSVDGVWQGAWTGAALGAAGHGVGRGIGYAAAKRGQALAKRGADARVQQLSNDLANAQGALAANKPGRFLVGKARARANAANDILKDKVTWLDDALKAAKNSKGTVPKKYDLAGKAFNARGLNAAGKKNHFLHGKGTTALSVLPAVLTPGVLNAVSGDATSKGGSGNGGPVDVDLIWVGGAAAGDLMGTGPFQAEASVASI